MLYADRQDLYWPLPVDWQDSYEAGRLLSVPSPWVTHYLFSCYKKSTSGSPLRLALTDLMMAEWVQNVVLLIVRATRDGLVFMQHPDTRHGPRYEGERR